MTLPGIGWLIATRRPENRIGWMLLAIGFFYALTQFSAAYAVYGLVVAPGSLPLADVMAWLSDLIWAPAYMLLILLPLVFPDGRLPSRRWRPIVWIASVALALMVVPAAIAYWPYRGPLLVLSDAQIPAGDPAPATADLLQGIGLIVALVVAVAGVAAIIIRFRRSVGAEHQQIKWFASAAVVEFAAIFVMSAPSVALPPPFDALAAIVLAPLIPIAVGIAILRYRLYDIDRIISRTVSYGAVTGILAVVFVGTILGLQTMLASFFSGSSVAVAASTLVVAAIFQPLRRRVQSVVDRRFNRSRYDAERTAAAFSTHLRDEVDLANLDAEVRQVIAATVAPVTVGLWIRHGGRRIVTSMTIAEAKAAPFATAERPQLVGNRLALARPAMMTSIELDQAIRGGTCPVTARPDDGRLRRWRAWLVWAVFGLDLALVIGVGLVAGPWPDTPAFVPGAFCRDGRFPRRGGCPRRHAQASGPGRMDPPGLGVHGHPVGRGRGLRPAQRHGLRRGAPPHRRDCVAREPGLRSRDHPPRRSHAALLSGRAAPVAPLALGGVDRGVRNHRWDPAAGVRHRLTREHHD